MQTLVDMDMIGQPANHRDQGVRNPKEEGQQGPNHIEPSKAGTEQKKANRGRIEQFGILHQQPSRSKAGGRRKNGGEVRAGHTLPEDVMEMTIGGAPRLNATGTGWVSVTPVSRAICSTQTKSSSGRGSSSPITSIAPIGFAKPRRRRRDLPKFMTAPFLN